MSYFTAVRIYSLVEVCIFAALLTVAISGASEEAELILGWTHGVGWIILCLLVAYGCQRKTFPWPLLAATVSPLGPVGSTGGIEYLARRGGSVTRKMFPLNLPNALTVVRILLVPVLVVALTVETPGGSTIAAIVFAIAALTDGLDGYIARSRQAVTNFGKVMDPVADKLMIAAALISLVSLDRVAAWVAMVIIAREFAVSGLRIAAGQQGVVIPASGLGKLKTIVQVAAVLALIAAPDHDAVWVQTLVYAMVGVTVVSGADYFLNFRRKLEESSRARTPEPGAP